MTLVSLPSHLVKKFCDPIGLILWKSIPRFLIFQLLFFFLSFSFSFVWFWKPFSLAVSNGCGSTIWKPSREHTRPLLRIRGLNGLSFTLKNGCDSNVSLVYSSFPFACLVFFYFTRGTSKVRVGGYMMSGTNGIL